jgi:hypothetical protein
VQGLFYPVLLGVGHSIALSESYSIYCFVLLKIVILRLLVVWNIGGTILAGGKTEVRGGLGGILALPLCPPKIWTEIEEPATNLTHGMALDFATIDLTVCKN